MFPGKEFDASMVAFELGDAAVNQAVDRLECVRDLEKGRRQDINAAEITSLNAELALRTEQRDELRDTIRRAPKPDASLRQSRAWYVVVAAILGLAGFAFAHLALTPFGIRWEVWPIAIALSVVCAYATDEALERCACERLVTAAALVSFVMSLAGLFIMALVRGDLLILFLRNAMSAGTLDTSLPAGIGDAAQFYQDAAWKLRLFFALLAVSMELATGLAIYGARKIAVPPPNGLAALRQQVQLVEAEMLRLLHRVEFLKREAEIFGNEFTRDFYLGLIKGAARRNSKHIGPLFCVVLLATACLAPRLGAQPLDVAVGIDLSLSSASRNYDGHLEHEKNIESAARLIATLPAAARFRIVGVSDQSFSRPLMLLEGRIPADRGQLELVDRIAVARRAYADQVRRVLRATPPTYPETDVIGFLLVAAELLNESPRTRKVLVIFSDMRHSAPPPNIERAAVVPVASALRTVERQNQIADLRGVDVYVYGAHAGDKDVPYWQSLRAFWTQYFGKSGAALKSFSMMRDVADIAGGR
jgi:hypothetical protein